MHLSEVTRRSSHEVLLIHIQWHEDPNSENGVAGAERLLCTTASLVSKRTMAPVLKRLMPETLRFWLAIVEQLMNPRSGHCDLDVGRSAKRRTSLTSGLCATDDTGGMYDAGDT